MIMKRKRLSIWRFLGVFALFFIVNIFPVSSAWADALRSSDDFKNIPVKVIRKLEVPAGYHEGLFYDGKNMWLANGQCGKIWTIDLSSGAVLATINPIGTFTEGITGYEEGSYFVTDWDAQRIYRARVVSGNMVADAEFSFEPAHPTGVIWTGKRLFAITWTRGMGTKFCLIEMDREMKPMRSFRIQRIHEPCMMAWDGKYLWISSWYSKQVYKVDIDTMEILGAFCAPVSMATGIAWDGKYMWITGTYGDIYQLEIGA